MRKPWIFTLSLVLSRVAGLDLSFSEAVSAGVAESLVASTTKAALLIAAGQATAGLVSATVVTLKEGVLRTMFIAKLKTATVVLFGVAALGLGASGLMYQTRAVAVESGQAKSIRPGGAAVQQEKVKGRRDEQAESDIEKIIRAELETVEKDRRNLEAEKQELKSQQEQAEKALRSATERMKAIQKMEPVLREEVINLRNIQAFWTQRPRTDEGEEKSGPRRSDGGDQPTDRAAGRQRPDPKIAVAGLEKQQAQLLEQLEQRRRALMQQLTKLEEEKSKVLAQIEKQRAGLMKSPSLTQQSRVPAGGDKLDQILQRLERLEQAWTVWSDERISLNPRDCSEVEHSARGSSSGGFSLGRPYHAAHSKRRAC